MHQATAPQATTSLAPAPLVPAPLALAEVTCQWLFALCALLQKPVNADVSASFRGLLRACCGMRAR